MAGAKQGAESIHVYLALEYICGNRSEARSWKYACVFSPRVYLACQERGKELEVRNIYINRGVRPPHRLLSHSLADSPMLESVSVVSHRPPPGGKHRSTSDPTNARQSMDAVSHHPLYV